MPEIKSPSAEEIAKGKVNYDVKISIVYSQPGLKKEYYFERTVNHDNGNICEVFDSEGRYLTKVLFKSFPRVWKNGKFYTIETDDDGYQYVKRYKVTWNY